MKYATIIGFIVLVFSSCIQKTSSKQSDEISELRNMKFKSGLVIDNGINRGTGYKDSLGTNYNIRYIPIKIKNDSSLSIKLHINFLKDYTNPFSNDNYFNIIPMKREWVVDGGEITDNMFVELKKDINDPQITKTLKPGEEFLFGIGTRYYGGKDYVAPLPQALFVQGDIDSITLCESMIIGDRTKSNLELGLKLIFNRGEKDERCAIIPCGRISYIEN